LVEFDLALEIAHKQNGMIESGDGNHASLSRNTLTVSGSQV
jgi:hypothetical protein